MTVDLHDLVAAYLGGVIRIEALDASVARLGEYPDSLSAATHDLWATLELRLGEYSSGDLDDAQMRGALIGLAPADAVVGGPTRPFTIRVSTGTSAARVNVPTVGTWSRSLVAGTQPLAARG